MKPVIKAPAAPVFSQKQVEAWLSEYSTLREQAKIIADRQKDLAELIKAYALKEGEADERGSYLCESDSFTYGAVSKTSTSYKDTAIDTLKAKGFTRAIKSKEVIDEKVLTELLSDGVITKEFVASLIETSISYSVNVTRKEAVTAEVEVSDVGVAASRRSGTLSGILRDK